MRPTCHMGGERRRQLFHGFKQLLVTAGGMLHSEKVARAGRSPRRPPGRRWAPAGLGGLGQPRAGCWCGASSCGCGAGPSWACAHVGDAASPQPLLWPVSPGQATSPGPAASPGQATSLGPAASPLLRRPSRALGPTPPPAGALLPTFARLFPSGGGHGTVFTNTLTGVPGVPPLSPASSLRAHFVTGRGPCADSSTRVPQRTRGRRAPMLTPRPPGA